MELEVLVKPYAADEVSVTNSSHDWDDVNSVALVFDFEVIGNERIVFKPNSNHRLVRTDVKAERNTVMIPTFESNW